MPPKSTPAAAPKPPVAPHTPSAMLRSRPSAKVAVRIASAAGERIAAPNPCKLRATMSDSSDHERPASSDAVGEDDDAGEEDAAAAEPVAEPPAEQQEAAEHQGVGADHPLQVLLREAEVVLDGRQRDVDDRDVEDGHELHDADQRQCKPFGLRGCGHGVPFDVGLGEPSKVQLALSKLQVAIYKHDAVECEAVAKRYDQYCPIAHALDLVGDRWSLLVVRELVHGPLRYTDIHERLHGCSTNILAARLRDLEAGGIVRRRQLPPPAASTVYELTECGAALRPVLRALAWWGVETLGPPAARRGARPSSGLAREGAVHGRRALGGGVAIEFRVGDEVAHLAGGHVAAGAARGARRRRHDRRGRLLPPAGRPRSRPVSSVDGDAAALDALPRRAASSVTRRSLR